MSDRVEIIDALRRALPSLAAAHRVQSLALFGSRARGSSGPGSDIDVLVRFEPGARVSLFTLAAVQTALEGILGAPVDVVHDHPHLRPSFRTRIEEDLIRVA